MAIERIKNSFDPLAFLAKVGTGKTISVYRKDQIIFSQGEVADTIFYIQKGGVKVVVQGSGRRYFRTRPILRRRVYEWPLPTDRNEHGDGRKPDHLDIKVCNDCGPA